MKFNTEKYMSFLMNMMTKIQKNRVLQGISKGFLMALPIVIMGSFALIITIIPIDPWKEFIVQSGIGSALSVAMKFTTNFVAVIYCFCIAYCSAKEFETSEGICGLLAVVAFFILTPFEVKTGNITMTWLGSQGLFVAMIVAIMTVVIYKYITVHGWTIKMPESVPAFVSNSFKNIVPGIVILSLYTIINALFSLTTYGHVHQFIYTLVQIPLQNIGGGIFAMIFNGIFMSNCMGFWDSCFCRCCFGSTNMASNGCCSISSNTSWCYCF